MLYTNTKNANNCFIISVSADLPRQLQIRGDLPKWDARVSWTAPIGGTVIKDIMLVQFMCLQAKSNYYLGKEFAKKIFCGRTWQLIIEDPKVQFPRYQLSAAEEEALRWKFCQSRQVTHFNMFVVFSGILIFLISICSWFSLVVW